jgi:uncharacterized protein GlcG (DUF336 family)
MRNRGPFWATVVLVGVVATGIGFADNNDNRGGDENRGCRLLPSWSDLRTALKQARAADNGGLDLDMWGTIVDRDGIVCAVAFTGSDRGQQWPGSRVISAQKANTANAFSLPSLALSTANLYTATQPGGSLFALPESNPVDHEVAYRGNPSHYGQKNDPMVGSRIGGVNVFGGGLALYAPGGRLLGGVGVSGDTSCADHNVAYRTRSLLTLDYVPGGVSGDRAGVRRRLAPARCPASARRGSAIRAATATARPATRLAKVSPTTCRQTGSGPM